MFRRCLIITPVSIKCSSSDLISSGFRFNRIDQIFADFYDHNDKIMSIKVVGSSMVLEISGLYIIAYGPAGSGCLDPDPDV